MDGAYNLLSSPGSRFVICIHDNDDTNSLSITTNMTQNRRFRKPRNRKDKLIDLGVMYDSTTRGWSKQIRGQKPHTTETTLPSTLKLRMNETLK